MLKVKCIESVICGENGYILWNEGASDCVLVDPGFSANLFLDFMAEKKLTNPAAILCTHGHADHIGGIAAIRDAFPEVPIVIGKKDADKLTDSKKNLSHHFGVHLVLPKADVLLSEPTSSIRFAGLEFRASLTPGHSAGHVIYFLENASSAENSTENPNSAEFAECADCCNAPKFMAFVGDVIFYGSIGRSDFADGNAVALEKSIRDVVYALPNETVLFTGHGPATTVGMERRTNPYVQD